MPMLTDPWHIFAALCVLSASIFCASRIDFLKPVFNIFPPVVWLYLLPMALSSLGIVPTQSPVYGYMIYLLLPMALFLLTIGIDLPSLMKIGRPATIAMLTGTLGVCAGLIVSYVFLASWLPDDSWKAMATMAGTWIGGSANFAAMQQNIALPEELLPPLIVTDAFVGYGWLGLVIFLSSFQTRIDKWLKADMTALDTVTTHMNAENAHKQSVNLPVLIMLIGFGIGVAVFGREIGAMLPTLGDPPIFTASTWSIIIVVTLGLILSQTPVRKARYYGSSEVGYVSLYLMLPAISVKADISAFSSAIPFLLAMLLALAVHISILLLVAKRFKLPAFFIATGSIANIGGVASGPVAAAAYRPSLAPVGALMGVAGNILGVYVPLGVAWILAYIATSM